MRDQTRSRRWLTDDEVQAILDRAGEEPEPPNERADGRCVCERCGRLYSDHPRADPWLWLTVLCDDRLVKL